MTFSSLFNGATLSVKLSEDFAFVHPSCDPDWPTRDPILHGSAILTLSSARQVSEIKVVLEGLSDAYGGSGSSYESTQTLYKELVLDLKDELFEAGTHAFEFSFIVPSNTAVYQRCVFGRVRHSIKATAKFPGRFSPSVSSSPANVYLVANPSPPGELPDPVDISIQHYSEDLGPVGIGIASPYLTVASLLSTRVTLLGPPQPVTIVGIESFIQQQYEISFNDSRKNVKPERTRYKLKKVDPFKVSPSLVIPVCVNECLPSEPRSNAADRLLTEPKYVDDQQVKENPCCPVKPDVYSTDPTPLRQLNACEGFHYSRTMRVPTDDHVRPTTLPGTETRIRVGHKVFVEIRYRLQGETSDKVLVIGKEVTIASCCIWLDSLRLPAYSKTVPRDSAQKLRQRCDCACSLPLSDMVSRDGLALVEAGSAFVLPGGESPQSTSANLFSSAGDSCNSPMLSTTSTRSSSSSGLKTPDESRYTTGFLVDEATRETKTPAYSENDGLSLPRYYSQAMKDEGI
ncbi:hypothetical protein OIO90_002360 [Microbotryomycetes sp. JL221]|nr:hypothetical protein OIO90_002360 [Microbotryomycetes sp. JL221]